MVAAHGLHGLLRVRAYQPPAPSLAPDRLIRLEQAAAGREARIASAAPHGRGLVLVALTGVGDRFDCLRRSDERAKLVVAQATEIGRQRKLTLRRRNVLDEGCRVGRPQRSAGIVHQRRAGTADREHLIPVVAEVVRAIDRAGRRVVIEPPPGLLD